MYKIYINDRPLILCDQEEVVGLDLKQEGTISNYHLGHPKHLINYVDMLEKGGQVNRVILYNDDHKALFKAFKNMFVVIHAAGGLLKNERGEELWIYRRGKWDLPKGKIEKDEKKRDAAVREVIEETGLDSVELGDKICKTYHTYRTSKKRVLKISHWYHMTAKSQDLIPQTEEDIEVAEWSNTEASKQHLKDTYSNIKGLFENLKSDRI